MSKIIKTGSNSRTKLLKGVKKLSNAVVTTLGPNGRNVVISQQGQVFPISTKDCQCRTNGYVIRPLISNKNWGGVGKSCGAPSQTLQVILKRSDGNSL